MEEQLWPVVGEEAVVQAILRLQEQRMDMPPPPVWGTTALHMDRTGMYLFNISLFSSFVSYGVIAMLGFCSAGPVASPASGYGTPVPVQGYGAAPQAYGAYAAAGYGGAAYGAYGGAPGATPDGSARPVDGAPVGSGPQSSGPVDGEVGRGGGVDGAPGPGRV